MKRTIILIVITAVVIVGAILGTGYLRNSQEANQQNSKNALRSEKTDTNSSGQPISGSYTSYSDEAFDQAEGRRVLFFHAPWCPQCRMIDEDIKKDGVPDGASILKVDYDSNQDLRQKYEVTLQTTFVEVDENDSSIMKFVAYNEPTFDSVKRELDL